MTAFPDGITEAVEYDGKKALVQANHNSRSHTGNAERFARQSAGEFIYADGIGWLAWDGKRWMPDDMDFTRRAVVASAQSIWLEAEAAFDLLKNKSMGDEQYKEIEAKAKNLRTWARDSEQAPNIRNTLECARGHVRFRVSPTDLDAQPTLLNVQNGTLDLKTFELLPHDPANRLTKVTNASYNAAAQAPVWEANLERFIPDPEVRAYLQRWVGAALYGRCSRELQYLWGLGANFKTTFTRALEEVLADYAFHTEPDILVGSKGRKSVSDKALLAELRGKRLVTTSEIDQGQALAEGMVKVMTEPIIRGEFKHRDGFNFHNEMDFMFSANHKLSVEGTDNGIWDRLRLTEWGVSLPEAERDAQFFEKCLEPELDGILAWAVRGAQDYHERGDKTDPPEQVMAWTQTYREQSDVVARWLAEECELASDAEAVADDLWYSFEAFTKNEQSPRVSRSAWKKRLADAGLHWDRRRLDGAQKSVVEGIRLLVTI